ncbi:hypothetical protein SDC9_204819 [bioreactor metagenome]|uniref:Uncharacterized protein n=1 Tax=bioreactor metagenome TaxID=1076179 RepID=A0A645J0A5_9ZZZZ
MAERGTQKHEMRNSAVDQLPDFVQVGRRIGQEGMGVSCITKIVKPLHQVQLQLVSIFDDFHVVDGDQDRDGSGRLPVHQLVAEIGAIPVFFGNRQDFFAGFFGHPRPLPIVQHGGNRLIGYSGHGRDVFNGDRHNCLRYSCSVSPPPFRRRKK